MTFVGFSFLDTRFRDYSFNQLPVNLKESPKPKGDPREIPRALYSTRKTLNQTSFDVILLYSCKTPLPNPDMKDAPQTYKVSYGKGLILRGRGVRSLNPAGETLNPKP